MLDFYFQYVFLQLPIASNKNREKSNTLKFPKLIIRMELMQYNAPNRGCNLQKNLEGRG